MNGGRFEKSCWAAGLILLSTYALCRADAGLGRVADLSRVRQEMPDTSNWADSRRRAYRASLSAAAGPLLGAVRIPNLHLDVPLYADTSELHLNRGAGLIAGTAPPGPVGNVGVAGHRDGFFRALKDARPGQLIEVRTRAALYRYEIAAVSIVPASDARLLLPTRAPTLTLVTCYPFYFVGNAPQRFVVRGALVSTQE